MEDGKTEPEQIKISIFTPLIYVGILLTCFVTFSIVYRRRKLRKLSTVQPVFSENHASRIYAFLKERYNDPAATPETKPHERVMKAALLRRGAEAIRRSLKLKENEPYFNRLYQEGLIGDDIFKNFEIQAKFQELELKDIVKECESYKKGWSQTFFTVCQEICFNEALRRRLNSIHEREEVLSELWQYSEKKPCDELKEMVTSNGGSDTSVPATDKSNEKLSVNYVSKEITEDTLDSKLKKSSKKKPKKKTK